MDPNERRERLEKVVRELEGLRSEAVALDLGFLAFLIEQAFEEAESEAEKS